MNAKQYTYRVIWSEEDQEFVGLCAEFHSLSWLAEDQEEALRGIVALVKDIVTDMERNGETAPSPLALQKYSGKFQVRTTPEVHRQLSMEAAEAGVSLNRLIN
ncbi:type II toxin-antitoxin system HicB family antitoxin, partial [Desulfovibrio sp. OttesenSCG-928-A18]|nr:type II toxin-antitoxin system HicB family antitoxin [Desulfovibrio sp. OttesenSCG-928-A18]